MSLPADDLVQAGCPRCGGAAPVRLYESLNPERFPEARELLRARALHRATCPGCQQTLLVDAPVLYTDFELGLWVHCLPEAWRPHMRQHEADARQLFAQTFAPDRPGALALGASLRLRVAFGLEELREKMILAEAALDDRHVEILKLELLATHPALRPADVRRVIVDAVDDRHLHLVAFAGNPLQLLAKMEVDRAWYDQLHAQAATLAAHYPALHDAPCVSLHRYRAEDGE
ncbi:MAG: CpXC domain-containing protein [Myxococcales bacterium]|nr:CpXC domain-containing protein [Myxococcales bacterium]